MRSFGEVPIVHNNAESLNAGDYNTYPKVKRADVYEYILLTLEKAIELLPENGAPLVRSFGEVPIVHNNAESLNAGDYNTYPKVKRADVYEYILLTLEKAMELLPETNAPGRIDRYCAEALLAKTYLSMAGISGELNQGYLDQAAAHALHVIENSGRSWRISATSIA